MLSVTEKIIDRLYQVIPPDKWDWRVFDELTQYGEGADWRADIVPHKIYTYEVIIYQTEKVRDAIKLAFVIKTVPPKFAPDEPERPSAAVRLESNWIPAVIAECNSGAEKDPVLMQKNVNQFLRYGAEWERFLLDHMKESHDELAVMLGEETIEAPTGRVQKIQQAFRNVFDRCLPKIDPIDREAANLRSHMLLEIFFKEGVRRHFNECGTHAPIGESLLQDVSTAAFMAERIEEYHLNASKLAYQKLKILRGE